MYRNLRTLFLLTFLSTAFFVPHVAFAVTTLQVILKTIGGLINQMMPIVVGLALVAFFWGLAMYLFDIGSGGGGSTAHSALEAPATSSKRDGRSIMLMGIVVFFVMISVWGLVNVLQNTFKIYQGNITPPAINNPYK